MERSSKDHSSLWKLRLLLFIVFFSLVEQCRGQYGSWWSIASKTEFLGANAQLSLLGSASLNFCSRLEGLSKGQERICSLHQDHMMPVAQGAGLAIKECQSQFRNRRWNCSAVSDNKTDRIFGPVMKIGSRETAFVNAISAAGVTYAISRSCREGEISTCSCSRAEKPKRLPEEWAWGGCGDNVRYGYEFAKSFTDTREKEVRPKKGSPAQARASMNLFNNQAGRMAVYKAAKPACKCHGVSGSCSLRTCWQQLPPFREIGKKIKLRYDAATKMAVDKRGNLQVTEAGYKKPSSLDLVYLEESPDYCVYNKKTGSLGTKDRRCNPLSQGTDGCEIMCCGRGFNTKKEVVREQCDCKFQWCCYVVCKTCERTLETHTCK
ncbi:hypothetical protein RvY_04983 [Ramazzottius varieornatus]|uniref:Protein Wnt n=1 Tax=Ramazzottius varieornatus TaxID=947166 RepID=A0A1D1UX09_RAMVA|nr:hypothetical protein RvY_04983 [Ramazzottius varieornatus]